MPTHDQARPKPPAQFDSRILAGGVDFLDFLALQERCVKGGEDWPSVCEEIGDRHAAYAREEREKGHTETARYFFLAAEAVYRIGQYGILELIDERLRLYHKFDDNFAEF